MKLVVIEGPGKRDTIKKYLGDNYEVMATKGHVRDLPTKSFGINMNNFEPEYQIMADKGDIIKHLKDLAGKADEVLLATDPDREGEAISWHIANILGFDKDKKCRIVFNEISKDTVQNALKNPRALDQNLIDAQQARRVLDRIVGYKISPILCKKIQPKLSAGRVQSVALKLVVERENEIENFVPQEYWTVTASLRKQKSIFKAYLHSYKGKKDRPESKEKVDEILVNLKNAQYTVDKVKKTKTKSKAQPPFTTSTMQQDALNKLGMSLKKTSSCAQMLYEGVSLGNEGKVALITYIRSDSTRVSEQAQASARDFVKQKYGDKFVPTKPNIYATKSNAQDAHEAIRPINIKRTPESVKEYLTADNYKLYKLIYDRFLASQMSEAIYNNIAVDIKANDCLFKASGKTIEFAGWTAVYKSYEEDENKEDSGLLPQLEENENVILEKLVPEQKFTKPPLRYTEASLVKAMEEKGIGRPATYAPTITLLDTRKYTEKEGRYLKPTELGRKITEYLDQFFKQVINVKFTAFMESRLDDIAEKGQEWKDVVSSFWNSFKDLLYKADKSSVSYKTPPVQTDILCEKCGKPMVIREGRYGKFLGCSNFPACKNIQPLKEEVKTVGICPICHKPTVIRKSKKGKVYYSCTGYPDCNFMSWDEPIGEKCPQCKDGYLIKKKNQIRCNACEYKKES